MPNIAAGVAVAKRSSPRKILQELIAPDLKELKSELYEFRAEIHSELKRLDEKIDSLDRRLDEKIDSLDRRLDEKIDLLDKRLDEKTDSMYNELLLEISRLHERINSLDKKIETGFEFRERFAALEVKIAALTAFR